MSIVGIFLMVLGAILAFAVETDVPGINVNSLGIILLLIGLAAVLYSLVFWSNLTPWGRRRSSPAAAWWVASDRSKWLRSAASTTVFPGDFLEQLLTHAFASRTTPNRFFPRKGEPTPAAPPDQAPDQHEPAGRVEMSGEVSDGQPVAGKDHPHDRRQARGHAAGTRSPSRTSRRFSR